MARKAARKNVTRSRAASPRRKTAPARRTTMRRTTRTIRRRATSYGRGLLGGMSGAMDNVLAGALGGAAGNFAGRYNARFGPAVGMGAVGIVMKNPTLQTIAGISLGQNVLGMVAPSGSGNTTGGWY